MKEVLTTCGFCGCGCGLYLREEGGELIGVCPSKAHPVSRGRLCMRGWSAHEVLSSPARLRTPLIKENGAFREATWEEALDIVASRFAAELSRGGGTSVGVLGSARCTNEENFLLMKLARAGFKTNNVDHPPRLTHAPAIMGLSKAFGFGAMTNSIGDLDAADVIMICGSNPTEQHPAVASRILDAVDRGAKLIAVDPRRNQMARFADIYLQPRPGTDLACILGMLNVILTENLMSGRIVGPDTVGYAALMEKVLEFSPERAEEFCGVSADVLKEAAVTYARAENAMILISAGITQHATGTSNVLGLADLVLVTGQIGKPASGLNPLVVHCNGQGACDMGLMPDMLTGYRPVSDRAARKEFESAWRTELPIEDGLNAYEMIGSALDGRLRAMFVLGGDVFVGTPEISRARQALEKLDFLAVQDLFLTDTAQLADVVLPAGGTACAEGTFTSTERRVQRVRSAVPDPSGKADWEALAELLRRMGIQEKYESPADIMDEIASLTPVYSGINYERLEAVGGVQWGADGGTAEQSAFLYGSGFPEGRPQVSVVDFIAPEEKTDADYPFLMSIGRLYYYWNTSPMTARSPTLSREYSAPLLDYPLGLAEIHPEDAKELGIRDGAKIKLASRHGELELQAMVSDIVPPKVVFVPFYLREQAAFLAGPTQDAEAKMPTFKVSAVRVERA